MALGVLIGWQVLMLGSVVVAVLVAWQRRMAGIGRGVAAVVGGVLCYGFVSATVGLAEGTWSASSVGFIVSMGIGVLGLASFGFGLLGLRRTGA